MIHLFRTDTFSPSTPAGPGKPSSPCMKTNEVNKCSIETVIWRQTQHSNLFSWVAYRPWESRWSRWTLQREILWDAIGWDGTLKPTIIKSGLARACGLCIQQCMLVGRKYRIRLKNKWINRQANKQTIIHSNRWITNIWCTCILWPLGVSVEL